nr:putative reverse transcriptase domain-containing protein [Tanacetum cinerariifolium]
MEFERRRTDDGGWTAAGMTDRQRPDDGRQTPARRRRSDGGFVWWEELNEWKSENKHPSLVPNQALHWSTLLSPLKQPIAVNLHRSLPLLWLGSAYKVTNEKVSIAKKKLKEARSRQKSYVDRYRRALEFKPVDRVFLKISPCRDRVGEVSYRLALLPQLSHVHNVFHVSLLRCYNYHPYHVVQYLFDKIRQDLSFAEEPEAILDRQERDMRKKTIPLVKVL